MTALYKLGTVWTLGDGAFLAGIAVNWWRLAYVGPDGRCEELWMGLAVNNS